MYIWLLSYNTYIALQIPMIGEGRAPVDLHVIDNLDSLLFSSDKFCVCNIGHSVANKKSDMISNYIIIQSN